MQALYQDGDSSPIDTSAFANDKKLMAEHDALAQVRDAIDTRDANRPDAKVISAIVSEAKKQFDNRDSRSPLQLVVSHSLRSNVFRVAIAACALFVAVAVGLRVDGDSLSLTSPADIAFGDAEDLQKKERLAEAVVGSESESGALAFSPAEERADDDAEVAGGRRANESVGLDAPAATVPPAITLASEIEELAWQETDEFRALRSRIEMLDRSNQELNWDDAVAPLEALPISPRTNAGGVILQQAGTGRDGQ